MQFSVCRFIGRLLCKIKIGRLLKMSVLQQVENEILNPFFHFFGSFGLMLLFGFEVKHEDRAFLNVPK